MLLADNRCPIRPLLPAYDVVIPAYRRAHCVTDAAMSVLEQNHPASRIVIVDDHSRDTSAALIRGLAERFPSVTAAILPRNGGASNARNVGMALCDAPWIAFLDSDDIWLPGAARAMLCKGESAALDVVVGQFARVEGDAPPQAPECGWDGDDIRRALAGGGVIGPSWAIMRRDVAVAIEGFDPSYRNCNDWDFYTRAAAHGARFGRIDETVALYRTVAGDRLGHDAVAGEANAARVRAHPYLAAHVR